jgi:hypothetical protein
VAQAMERRSRFTWDLDGRKGRVSYSSPNSSSARRESGSLRCPRLSERRARRSEKVGHSAALCESELNQRVAPPAMGARSVHRGSSARFGVEQRRVDRIRRCEALQAPAISQGALRLVSHALARSKGGTIKGARSIASSRAAPRLDCALQTRSPPTSSHPARATTPRPSVATRASAANSPSLAP